MSGRISILATCAVAWMLSAAAARADDCHIGAYRLNNGDVVDIGASEPNTLRWRTLDGASGQLYASGDEWTSTYGWTGRADNKVVRFGDCGSGEIEFAGQHGLSVPFVVRDTTFVSHGVTLAGRLVLPPNGQADTIVVLLQGSEHDSARTFDALQRILPALGVGAFVYDKRGVGASGGAYTQDFWLLADDAVAALHTATELAGGHVRAGFLGPSQGGWVAPIAATHSSPDFVISTFGLAVSVIEEDREAVELEMRLKGHSAAEIAQALEVADAAETVFASGFTEGIEAFDALRTRYRSAPWFADLHGNYTWFILDKSVDEIRASGAAFRWQTPFRYDPLPVIAAVRAPQLWVLGGLDLDAPSATTLTRLRTLMRERRPITAALYPNAEHGMTEFETTTDGKRASTRYATGYFQMLADFARFGRLSHTYGDAQILR